MHRTFTRITISLAIALGGINLRAAPASATDPVFAEGFFLNNTTRCISLSGDSISNGTWWNAGQSYSGFYNVAESSGAPVAMLGAGQMMDFGTQNNTLFVGTGGSLSFAVPNGTATINWGLSWCYIYGCGGSNSASASVNGSGSPFSFSVAGVFGCGGDTCGFAYQLNSSVNYEPSNGQMLEDQCLSRGTYPLDHVTSSDGRFTLQLQTDGNLVLVNYSVNPPQPLWASNTYNSGANVAYMQSDGNFVLYDIYHNARWTSNTQGNPGSSLVIDNDGDMRILSDFNVVLWQTNTGGH